MKSLIRYFRHLLLAAASLAALTAPVSAQDPIEVFITIDQPVPPYIIGWQEQIFVSLQVSATAPETAYDVVLLGRVQHLDESSINLRTTSPSRQLRVERPGERTLSGIEISELFGADQVESNGLIDVENISVADRGIRVPEGRYEICVEVLDAATQQQKLGDGCSLPFRVQYVDPPRLILPEEGATLALSPSGELSPPFQWENFETFGVPLAYEFIMVEVPEGVAPNDAIEDGALYQFRESTGSPFYFTPELFPSFPLRQGSRYAWRVQASDPTGTVHVREGGLSEVRSFVYGAPAELAVVVDPAAVVSLTPADPTATLPTRIRIFGPAPPGGLATLESVSVTVLEGMRMLHGPITVPISPDPIGVLSPVVEMNINVTLPASAFDVILGTRSSGTFTLRVDAAATTTSTGERITGFDEVPVRIARSDLVVRMTSPTGAAVLSPTSTRIPVEFEFQNLTSSPISIARLRQEWDFPGLPAPPPYEGDITETAGTVITVPAGGTFPFSTGFNFDPADIARQYAAAGTPQASGSFTVRYTFISDDGSIRAASSPDLRVEWSVGSAGALTARATTDGGFPIVLPTGATVGPVTYFYTNSGTRTISVDSTVTTYRFRGGDVAETVRDGVPPEFAVVTPPGATESVITNVVLGRSAQERISADSRYGGGPLTAEVLHIGRDDLGVRYTALTSFEVQLGGEGIQVTATAPGGFPVRFPSDEYAAAVEYTFTSPYGFEVRLDSTTEVFRFPNGDVAHTNRRDVPPEWTINVPAEGTEHVYASLPISRSAREIILSDSRFTGDPLSVEVRFSGTDRSGLRLSTSTSFPVLLQTEHALTVTASSPTGFPVVIPSGEVYSPPLVYVFRNNAATPITLDSMYVELSLPSGEILTRAGEAIEWSDGTIPPGGIEHRIESNVGIGLERQAAILSDPRYEGELVYRARFVGHPEAGSKAEAETEFRVALGSAALSVRAEAPRGFPANITAGDRFGPITYYFRNASGSNVTIDSMYVEVMFPGGEMASSGGGPVSLPVGAIPGTGAEHRVDFNFGISLERQALILADPRYTGELVYRPTFFGHDASGRDYSASTQFPISLGETSVFNVTASTPGGFPLRLTTGTDRQPVSYTLQNGYTDDLRVVRVTQELLSIAGIREDSTTHVLDTPLVVPGEGTLVDERFFGLTDEGRRRLASDPLLEGTELTVRVKFEAVGETGGALFAVTTFPVVFGDPVLTVEASSEEGFPLNLTGGDVRRPVTYTFRNAGSEVITIESVTQSVIDASGVTVAGPNEFTRPGDPLRVPAGGDVSEAISYGLQAEVIDRLRDPAGPAAYRARVTFGGRDAAGLAYSATAEFPILIESSDLIVTATSPDGFPLQFYPGVNRRPVNYRIQNASDRPFIITWIQQRILETDGTVIDGGSRIAIEGGAVPVDPGDEITRDWGFGLTDAGWTGLRAGGDRRIDIEVIFTALYAGGEEVEGSVRYDAEVRLSPLRVTSTAPRGFPLNLYPGTDRQDVSYTYHNDGGSELRIVRITQVLQGLDGSPLSGENVAELTSPIVVPAGRSLTQDQFFGLPASSLTTLRATIPSDEHILRAQAYLTFTVRDPSGAEFVTPHSFPVNVTNTGLVVEAGLPGGPPLTYYLGETSKRLAYQFENFDSTPHSYVELITTVRDDRGDVVTGPTRLTRGPGAFTIPASAIAEDSASLTFTPPFFDRMRADGRDKNLTVLAQFAETTGGEPITETSFPMLVSMASAPGEADAPFVAQTPSHGSTVRGSTSFVIQARDSVGLGRVSSIYLQLFRVPSGVTDSAAAMVPENRLAERTFANSSASQQIRWMPDSRHYRLLESRGATESSDTPWEFTVGADSNYVWTARIDFHRAPDGTPGASSSNMQPALFGARPAIAECGAECTLTAPSGSGDRSRPAINFVGRTVTIGAFDLEITSATGTGADLDGEGHIDVPYLNAPVAVEFENLAINSSMQVVSGEAKAKTDRPDLLTSDYRENVTDIATSMSITEDQAEDFQEVAEFVESAGRIISAFTSSRTPVQLPLGIDQHIDGEFLLLAVIGIKFKPTGARLNAVLSVPLPELDTRLSVGARGICLTPAGFDEEITFYLATDLYITASELSASADDYTIRFKAGVSDEEGTYLKWQCGEMEKLRIEMWHEFPRDWLTPIDPATGEIVADSTQKSTAKLVVEIAPPGSSSGSGSGGSGGGGSGGSGPSSPDTTVTQATGLQWIAGVREFTPSAIADANGFWFSVESMVYDNSSVANAGGMAFPAGYPSSMQNNGWTGFYIGLIRLNMPDEIRSYGEDNNIELQVRHVLIDNTGLNFTVAVRNLLTLAADTTGSDPPPPEDCVAIDTGGTESCVGNLAGWQFSIDEISISVLHSSFGTAALRGQFKFPISDTPIDYSATLARPASLLPSGGSGGGSGGSGEPGAAARAFGLECTDLLTGTPRSGSGSGGSGSGDSGDSSSSSTSSSGEPDLIFEFLVTPSGDISGDIWGAELTIGASSKICVGNHTGELRAGAELNGRFGLGEDVPLPANITGVPFERIRVFTFAPYFEAPDFARTSGLGRSGSGDSSDSSSGGGDSGTGGDTSSSDSGDNGFAVDISNIGLEVEAAVGESSGRMGVFVGIGFDVSLRLPGDGAFRASAQDVIIWGKVLLETEDEPAGFEFTGFRTVPTFCVGGDAEALKIDGCIEVYVDRPDPRTPGATDSGVAGAINAVIAQQFGVRVAAEFGVRSQGDTQFEYFFVDAAVTIASGINIAGAVSLYGILGGVWYNMEGPPGFSSPESSDFGDVLAAPASTEPPSVEGVLHKYRPVSAADIGTWGFKAGIILGVSGNSDAFNIDVFVEAEISGAGNLNYIRLVGDAYVMTPINDRSDPKIRGTLVIELAFRPTTRADGSVEREAVFDASFVLTGNLEVLILDGSAGFHVEPAYWQFYIGRPDRRFSATLSVGGADIFRLSTYIMAGDRLPPFPDPPPGAPRIEAMETNRVEEVAGGEAAVDGEGNPTTNISGFMMGADFRIEPSLDLGIIGLDGYLQLGFDVAATQGLVYCLDETTMATFTRGDDGWYIEGRMYAMAGIVFWTRALFGVKATIARLDAGILLQGGFPNPEYFAGAADISGELLGAIRFSEHVEFVIGEPCVLAPRSPLEEIELITDLRPNDAAPHHDREVSPFADPTAAFFLDVDHVHTLVDETDRTRYFRIRSRGIEITDEDGDRVECRSMVRQRGAYQVCEPVVPGAMTAYHLEPESDYDLDIEVFAEERSRSGWAAAQTLEGDPIEESKEASFRTGCLPSELDGLISQTYPINGQRYFLQDETRFGFIDVIVNVNYLTSRSRTCGGSRQRDVRDLADEGYSFIVRFTPFPSGDPIDVDATLISQRFSFQIPNLNPETVYGAQLIRVEPEAPTSLADRLGLSRTRTYVGASPAVSRASALIREQFEENGELLIRNRVIHALNTTAPNEKRLYHWVFRTSRYGTLQEKIGSVSLGTPTMTDRFAFLFRVHTLSVPMDPPEPFDDVDIYGRGYAISTTDYTGGAAEMTEARPAVRLTTSPALFSGWASSSDPYLRYAERDVYSAERVLRRYGRRVGYPPSRAGRPTGREMAPLVFMKTTRSEPPLTDDPEALANLVARQARPPSRPSTSTSRFSMMTSVTTSRFSFGSFGGGTSRFTIPRGVLSFVNPQYSVEYNVGTAVSIDWGMMRSYGPRLIARRPRYCTDRSGSRCYSWAPINLSPLPEKVWLPFQRYMRGNYPVQFQYYPYVYDEFYPDRATRPPFIKRFRY